MKKLDVRLRLQRRATFAGWCILRLRCGVAARLLLMKKRFCSRFLSFSWSALSQDTYEINPSRHLQKKLVGQDGSKRSQKQSWFACQEEYFYLLGYYNLHKSLWTEETHTHTPMCWLNTLPSYSVWVRKRGSFVVEMGRGCEASSKVCKAASLLRFHRNIAGKWRKSWAQQLLLPSPKRPEGTLFLQTPAWQRFPSVTTSTSNQHAGRKQRPKHSRWKWGAPTAIFSNYGKDRRIIHRIIQVKTKSEGADRQKVHLLRGACWAGFKSDLILFIWGRRALAEEKHPTAPPTMGTLWCLVAMAPLFILDAVVHIGRAYRPSGGASMATSHWTVLARTLTPHGDGGSSGWLVTHGFIGIFRRSAVKIKKRRAGGSAL